MSLLIACGCAKSTVPEAPAALTPTPPTEQPTRRSDLSKTVPVEGTPFLFRDATADWNLHFERYDDINGQHRIHEGIGGGVAVFDFDQDGRLDLFFCQGCRLPRTKVTTEFTNELYRNSGRPENVTQASGLTSFGYHSGVVAGDVDADGFPDLYVTAFGRTSLWHNNGDGTFENIGPSAKVEVDSWSTSAILADFNDDGLLDLYVATYLQADDDPPLNCKEARAPDGLSQCSPTLFSALDDRLFINDGRGGFDETTRQSGIIGKDGKGLAAAACDFNGDGVLEIVVANDGTPTFLYVRTGLSTLPDNPEIAVPIYEERAAEYGIAVTGEGRTISGMSAAHGDYDRDGWPDLYVTNFYLEPNVLFHNLGGTGFGDASTSSRVGPPTRLTLSFGAEFLDVDHDGWLDLVATAGHIEDRTWSNVEPYKMNAHLFRNDRNGRFTDVASRAGSYFQSKWVGRGLALGDIDRDGDLDVVISHRSDPSVLLLNESPTSGSCVIIRPIGVGRNNRSAIGTRVVATGLSPVMRRDIAGGGSFQSTSALELHLGLADKAKFDRLECQWPDGEVELWDNVGPGYYVAVQGRGLIPVAASNFRGSDSGHR